MLKREVDPMTQPMEELTILSLLMQQEILENPCRRPKADTKHQDVVGTVAE